MSVAEEPTKRDVREMSIAEEPLEFDRDVLVEQVRMVRDLEPSEMLADYLVEAPKHRRKATDEGQDYWIAAPEDLILLKLIAGREMDFPTVKIVEAAQFRRLDLVRLRANARRLSAKVPDLPERVEKVLVEAAEIDRLASLPSEFDPA